MEGGTLDVLLAARDNVLHYTTNLLDTIHRGRDADHTLIRDALRAAEAATWLAVACRFYADAKMHLEVARTVAKERVL